MKKTRKILITNDDSINAEGINLLAEIMRNYGEVTVVAPLLPQSGKSAALSLGQKLFLNSRRGRVEKVYLHRNTRRLYKNRY